MNEKINSIIEAYLETENKTDYAIMINGKWGCGKTYYVEHELRQLIENKKIKYIYLSLNGCDNFAKIVNKITWRLLFKKNDTNIDDDLIDSLMSIGTGITQLHPTLSIISKCVSKVKDIVYKPVTQKFLAEINTEETVIIFDDIERISTNAQIEDIIGQIYENYTKKGYKTILIGDEINIAENEKYHIIKEKVIRRTILYNPDRKLQIDAFLKNLFSSSKNKEYLENNIDKIITYFIHTDITNLRTISFVIDNFLYVYDKLQDDMKIKLGDFVFRNIMLLTNEYKEGKITIDDFKSKKGLNDYPNVYYLNKALRERGTEIEKSYLDEFHHKYLANPVFADFKFIEEIFNFILTGYLNAEKLEKEIKALFQEEYMPESEKALDFLVRYMVDSEEKEFMENFEKLVLYLNKGEYYLSKLPYIYSLLMLVEKKGYIVDGQYDIKQIIRTSLTEAEKNPNMIPEYIDDHFLRQEYYPIEQNDSFYKDLLERIEEISFKKRNEHEKTEVIKIYQSIISYDKSYYHMLNTNNKLFQDTVKAKYEKVFFELPNRGIRIIESYIDNKFLKMSGVGQYSYDEKLALEQIIIFIETNIDFYSEKLDRLRIVRIKELVGYMKSAVEHLEATCRKT
ncbi:MAG: KAP family NTPase [Bacteroidetes bacterium]|nr:KAP family NTPase [Bacteroidota bacterium]